MTHTLPTRRSPERTTPCDSTRSCHRCSTAALVEGPMAAITWIASWPRALPSHAPHNIRIVRCLAQHRQELLAEFPHLAATEQRSVRSEEHTSALQSLMRLTYAVFCLTKK